MPWLRGTEPPARVPDRLRSVFPSPCCCVVSLVVHGCPLFVCCVGNDELFRGLVCALVILVACVVCCDIGGSNDRSTSLYLGHLATLVTYFEFFSKKTLFLGIGVKLCYLGCNQRNYSCPHSCHTPVHQAQFSHMMGPPFLHTECSVSDRPVWPAICCLPLCGWL